MLQLNTCPAAKGRRKMWTRQERMSSRSFYKPPQTLLILLSWIYQQINRSVSVNIPPKSIRKVSQTADTIANKTFKCNVHVNIPPKSIRKFSQTADTIANKIFTCNVHVRYTCKIALILNGNQILLFDWFKCMNDMNSYLFYPGYFLWVFIMRLKLHEFDVGCLWNLRQNVNTWEQPEKINSKNSNTPVNTLCILWCIVCTDNSGLSQLSRCWVSLVKLITYTCKISNFITLCLNMDAEGSISMKTVPIFPLNLLMPVYFTHC